MIASDVSPRSPLRWDTGCILPSCPPGSLLFEMDSYDWWHFRRLAAHDDRLFGDLIHNRRLLPLAANLYAALYKPAPLERKGPRDPANAAPVQLLMERGALDRLRTQTVLNEWATVEALGPLVRHLRDAAREAREAARRRDRDASASGGGEPQCSGMARVFEEQSAGGRAVHAALDAYEEARANLEQFDSQNGLANLPDAKPHPRGPRQLRYAGRKLPAEPPANRKGMPGRLAAERRRLKETMDAERTAFFLAKQVADAAREDAVKDLVANGDQRFDGTTDRVVAAVAQSLEVMREVMRLFQENDVWGRSPGALHQLPLQDLLALGNLIRSNRSLRDLVAIAGRWSATLKRKVPRSRNSGVPHEVVGVTLGGALARVLPSELMHLKHPILRRLALVRLLERRALSTELKGPDLLGRGPVIAVVDTSGSMVGARATFAKALCLAVALRCMEQRRPFHILTFGGLGEFVGVSMISTCEFHERLHACLGLEFGGGTDFDTPLRRVCALASQRPWAQADALFITDGECRVSDEVKAEVATCRKKCDLQVLGVLVAGGAGLHGVVDANFAVDPASPDELESDPEGAALLERVSGRL